LDLLLANLDKITQTRTREKLVAGRDQVLQNRKMVQLDCDIDLPYPIEDLRIRPDYPALIAAMEKCEFKSLLQEVRDEAAKASATLQPELGL
jgi:DNA polymerase-1